MKKLFIASLALNLGLILFLIGKRIYYSNSQPAFDYNEVRASVFTSLSIDTSDIVFVGNSLTEAFMVSEFFGPHCKNRGINGNRIKDIANRIDPIADKHPKKIFLEGGINDIMQNANPQAIASEYRTLIEIIHKLSPSTRIYVQSILPTCSKINRRQNIITANDLIKKLCDSRDVTFIDLYSSFQKDGYLIDSFTYDGIHLNGAGYSVWAEKVRVHL